MHLLYLDESGSVGEVKQKFFVLAGVAVFDEQTHWIEQKLNQIVERFAPEAPYSLELHGSTMRSGKEGWEHHKPQEIRLKAIKNALTVGIAEQHRKRVRLFGSVVRKSALSGVDPVEHAFEQISSRFDHFLKRCYNKYGNRQRGIIILDKSTTEIRLQT